MQKTGGRRDGLSLSYDNLFPIEAKAAAQAAFVYGAQKYSRKAKNIWERIFESIPNCTEIAVKSEKDDVRISRNGYELTVKLGATNSKQYDARTNDGSDEGWETFDNMVHTVIKDSSEWFITIDIVANQSGVRYKVQTRDKPEDTPKVEDGIEDAVIVGEEQSTEEPHVFPNVLEGLIAAKLINSEADIVDSVGTRNWEKGIPWQSLIESLKRHIDDFERGKEFDDGEGGSGLPQVSHIMASAAMLCASVVRGIGVDDRVKEGPETTALYAKDCSMWIKNALDAAEEYRNKKKENEQ